MKNSKRQPQQLYSTLYILIIYRFVLKNLKPGEAIVIIDYKMKLELSMRSQEIQRDWYGKCGISLHGFYVIAQVAVDKRRVEVLDLWCEDAKQDAWFTQSTLGICFAWMEKVSPNFHVYLFSDEYLVPQRTFSDPGKQCICSMNSQTCIMALNIFWA